MKGYEYRVILRHGIYIIQKVTECDGKPDWRFVTSVSSLRRAKRYIEEEMKIDRDGLRVIYTA